jgi:hypothetical protein
METGKKFHQTAAELIQVKEFSNELCREYGLSETEAKSSFKSMPKWKEMLRRKAYSVANNTCCKHVKDAEQDIDIYFAHIGNLNRFCSDGQSAQNQTTA